MPQPPRKPFRKQDPAKGYKAGGSKDGPSHFQKTRSHHQKSESIPKKFLPSQRSNETTDQGWDPVAAWYDKLVGETGSDYHRNVILPATLKMLGLNGGERIIDICCGQGVLVKPLFESGIAEFLGVDASPRLIQAAETRHGKNRNVSFLTADACKPGHWADGSYDAATCLMAVHDVPDITGLFTNVAKSLKNGGHAVLVFMHPCFRIPKKTHWGFDNDQKIQYRRIDSYGAPLEIQISTHPGKGGPEQTIFYHRPLSELISAMGNGGLSIISCEELYSHRRSQGGGAFSKAEHKAAEEFPMFIAFRCEKR